MNTRSRRRALSLVTLLALFGASCAQLADLPRLKDSDVAAITLAQSSKIYDGDGRLLTTLHGVENRTVVPLARISKVAKDAVVAIEDERFYEHGGVDVRAVLRALIANITSRDVREGGSTITQQYVKNTLIAPGETAAKTLERKIEEAALARQLEKKLTKDEILESYLNTVYFGQGAYGIQAAAKTYFGKGAHALRLPEAALLAGLIRAPENYDPFDRRRAAKERRNLVIRQMERLDYIDQTKADKAQASKLRVQPQSDAARYPAPYFVDYVRRLIKFDPRFEDVGKTPEQREQQLFQGGLRIYTTVDLEAQQAAEAAVERWLPEPSDPSASVVAIEPATGHVKAMVGGRDFFAPRRKDATAKVNLATVREPDLDCERYSKGRQKGACKEPFDPAPAPGAGRQAGSAFKTFALVAAIEKGIPLTKVYDAGGDSIVIRGADNGKDYPVQNYEGTVYGRISLLDATISSVNTVYAQLGQEIGPEAVVDTAEAMGIRTELLPVASAPLGTNVVNPLGMASAYGTLATNGVHHPPVAITRIVDDAGKVIYQHESEAVDAVEPPVAYLATTALEQVIQRGTGTAANIGRPAAGKTGTAQEYRDAWFVGYTPDLVASVWVGYPDGQIEMKPSCVDSTQPCRVTRVLTSSGVTGGSYPARIWQAFMAVALADHPATPFHDPGSELVVVTIDTRTTCLADDSTPAAFRASATFAKGTEPKERCRVEGTTVPDVFGFPVAEAIGILEGSGFTVAQVKEASTTYPPGRVIGQSPVGGTRASRGTVVTIAVSVRASEEDQAREVPYVLGLSRAHATARLEDAGFNVNAITQRESSFGRSKKNR